ncbi:DUF3545 family protein [uncultured Vibrio sp.]|uniref:DUF3545 family protein n=1 Tax=uncultured Vibrio sp. TaxID=114054 RepID=UPI000916E8E5|nr:DUF3545 family protein [uncultured Vibrio sp.]OIQ25193.1 MAG: DUF3545 domain-containing protein [Vibrio sp. MedPE-SWchi]
MEGIQFDEVMETSFPRGKAARSKPVKRKWREIEAIKDRQRLQKELLEMDMNLKVEDLDL